MARYGLAVREFGECAELVTIRRVRRQPLTTMLVSPRPADLKCNISKLFEQFSQPLYRYVLSIVDSEAEAEDITQDSFLRLHSHSQTGESLDNPKAWLFRVGYNLAIDIRRRKRHEPLDQTEGEAEHRDSTAHDPERLAIENQRRDRIADAVGRLSEQQRQCLTLRSEGFRHREIAGILGVSESTVAENLRRGVLRLTRELHGA